MFERLSLIKSAVAASGGAAGSGAVAIFSIWDLDWLAVGLVMFLSGVAGMVAWANRAAKAQTPITAKMLVISFLVGNVSGSTVFLVVSTFGWDIRLSLAIGITGGVMADRVIEKGPFAFLRTMDREQ